MKKTNTLLFVYYLGLLIVLLLWNNTVQAPSILMRCLFLAASIIPAIIYDQSLLSPVIICFMAIGLNGFAHSYMPDNQLFYILILLACLPFRKTKASFHIPNYLWALLFYVFIIDLVTGFTIEKVTLTIVVAILLLSFTSSSSFKDIQLWSLCFTIISIGLSLLYLFNRERFAESYYMSDLERTIWMDPNYFGMVIGMGVIVSLVGLLGFDSAIITRRHDIPLKVLYFATMLLSVPVLLLNASRGSLLAVGIASTVAIVFSDISLRTKLILSIIIIAGLVLLYNNSFFDLIIYRIENENTEGGNGRYYIWGKKLRAFFEGDTVSMIFGYGYTGGLKLAYNSVIRGTHNDYISFLVEYGFIGCILFLQMLVRPVLFARKRRINKASVAALMSYLVVCCFTIEPISGGYIPYLFFYSFILIIAYCNTEKHCLI